MNSSFIDNFLQLVVHMIEKEMQCPYARQPFAVSLVGKKREFERRFGKKSFLEF